MGWKRSQVAADGTLNGGNLIVVGDSISATGGGPAGTTTYPSQIASAYPSMTLHNTAVSGQRITEMVSAMSTQIDANVNGAKLWNAVVLLAGANDIALDLHSGSTVYSSVSTIVSHCKGLGIFIVVCTCTDLVLDGTQEQDLLLPYNSLIRSNSAGAHAIVDLWTLLGNNNGSPRPANFFDDLHPSQAGQNLMYPAVRDGLLSVI